MRKYVLVNVRYTIQTGKREEFYRKLQEEKITTASRQEPGNIKYDFYYPLDSSDDMCLMEMWTNQHELKRHAATAHYNALSRLKEIYVKKIKISKYGIEEYV
nr:antibiotic biosynthesis monooxygenase family protein [Kineothrix alysoides]